jgi:formylglycine-generating enzyme required for sulfatase activity
LGAWVLITETWYKTGESYRLPSETELRYTARAGQAGSYIWDTDANQCNCANGADQSYHDRFPNDSYFNQECRDGYVFTSPVGAFQPNNFGIYDAFGNVFQRVADCYNEDWTSIPLDGTPNKTSSNVGSYILFDTEGRELGKHSVTADTCAGQVALGGSWAWAPFVLSVDHRNSVDPAERNGEIGFRLARSLTKH